MKAHVIENGLVVNTILVESLDVLPNLISAENGGAIGDRYENGQFVTPEPDINKAALEIREQRNQKLKDSDWTQVADAPVDQAAWAAYRQALRDIPSQQGFPWDVQWPTQPE
jgi:Phage tail assembly chaperone protein